MKKKRQRRKTRTQDEEQGANAVSKRDEWVGARRRAASHASDFVVRRENGCETAQLGQVVDGAQLVVRHVDRVELVLRTGVSGALQLGRRRAPLTSVAPKFSSIAIRLSVRAAAGVARV